MNIGEHSNSEIAGNWDYSTCHHGE